ncbi:hypothetical protein VDBG_01355 [Verticillium alfalfae VaMs.102]|uniref:Uncharacterized protein n=1 Tax=Verticillium alfalfae (strain VaMs.102 / ATCC MYA-4576 / FGSC 10136) TaxID=526221 RepID=C9S7F0_VERA1|nr:hypothetical protein VDBG_01355 [Verticillium alfalfae VaMs.102]EEY15246.1 hypothetical protein VDBG_01355 [Verticillium alfalfae VaMs.102]
MRAAREPWCQARCFRRCRSFRRHLHCLQRPQATQGRSPERSCPRWSLRQGAPPRLRQPFLNVPPTDTGRWTGFGERDAKRECLGQGSCTTLWLNRF